MTDRSKGAERNGPVSGSSSKPSDLDIWDKYKQTVSPIRAKRRTAGSEDRKSRSSAQTGNREEFESLLDGTAKPHAAYLRHAPQPSRKTPISSHSPPDGPAKNTSPRAKLSPKPPSQTKVSPASNSIDPHLLRRTKRGTGFDARIDLHGLRRDDAYHALLGFLSDCQRRHLKLALVITGKGTNSKEAQDWWDMPERGVLKRLVPQWLTQPAFSRMVAGYSQASRHDGGGGALYVQVRSVRRTTGSSVGDPSR